MPRESISPSWEEFCKYKGIKIEYPLTKADFYFDEKDEFIYLPSFREWDQSKEPIYIDPKAMVNACFENLVGGDMYGVFSCSCSVPGCNGFFEQNSFLVGDRINISTRDDGVISFDKSEFMENGLKALKDWYKHIQKTTYKKRAGEWYPDVKQTENLIKQMEENICGYYGEPSSVAEDLLVIAFMNFDKKKLEQAVSDGADINFNPDKYDTSLLARALYEAQKKNIDKAQIIEFISCALKNGLSLNTKSEIKEFELDNSVFICEFIKDDEIVEFLLKSGMNVKDNTWNYWNLSNNSDPEYDDDNGFPINFKFYKSRLKLVQKDGAHRDEH